MLNSNKTPDIFGGGLQADFVAEKRAPMPAAREREDSRRALRGAAALGTITKYPATGMGAGSGATSSIAESGKIEVIDPETGEITAFERSGSGAFVQAKRSFEDGRQARYSLHRAFKQIEPKHRTAQCLWSVVSAEKTVQVMLDQEHNRARYNNLRVCGRVWPCPFCSAKISERRALELAGAMAVAKAKGVAGRFAHLHRAPRRSGQPKNAHGGSFEGVAGSGGQPGRKAHTGRSGPCGHHSQRRSDLRLQRLAPALSLPCFLSQRC